MNWRKVGDSWHLFRPHSKRAVAIVVPDKTWAGMWRIQFPDGTLSDLLNFARARDGARRDYLSNEIQKRAA